MERRVKADQLDLETMEGRDVEDVGSEGDPGGKVCDPEDVL